MASKRVAFLNKERCVSCGACSNICPMDAVSVSRGMYAEVNGQLCVGCGKCVNVCPALCIELKERT
jgi:MinD superfamily P-loop ATPase